MNNRNRIYCNASNFGRIVEVRHVQVDMDQAFTAIARPLLFDAVAPADEGQFFPPTYTLRHEEAQNLMEELWNLGFRPERAGDNKGQLGATQTHLADMRAMVAALAKVEFPK